jgi:hypothetical protein
VWVTHLFDYETELRRLNGAVLKTIRRDVGWFRPSSQNNSQPFFQRPDARMTGVSEVRRNLLLVLTIVADENWKPLPLGTKLDFKRLHMEDFYDTIVEYIDVPTGRAVVTQRYDDVLRFVSGSNYLWSSKKSAAGALLFEILEPQLKGW